MAWAPSAASWPPSVSAPRPRERDPRRRRRRPAPSVSPSPGSAWSSATAWSFASVFVSSFASVFAGRDGAAAAGAADVSAGAWKITRGGWKVAAGTPGGSVCAGAGACPAAGAAGPVTEVAGLANGAANGAVTGLAWPGALPAAGSPAAGRLAVAGPAPGARPVAPAASGDAVAAPASPFSPGAAAGAVLRRVRRAGRRVAVPPSACSPACSRSRPGRSRGGRVRGDRGSRRVWRPPGFPAVPNRRQAWPSAVWWCACAAPPWRRARRSGQMGHCCLTRHCWTLCRVARCRASGLSPVKLPGADGRDGPSAPRGSWSHATSLRAPADSAVPPVRVISSCGPPGMLRTRGCGAACCSSSTGSVSPLAAAAAPSALSAPCASRVTSGGDDGARAATRRSAARMSSGRTAGMTCRTTIRSMAFPALPPAAAHRSVPIVITAARASMRRGPLLVRRSTSRLSQARNSSAARAASAGGTPGRTTCHRDASSGSAPSPGAGLLVTSITSIPSGRAASSRSRTSDTAHALVSESSRYSASLAVPVGAAPA